MRKRRDDDGYAGFDVEKGRERGTSTRQRLRRSQDPPIDCLPSHCRSCIFLTFGTLSLLLMLHETYYYVILSRIDLGIQTSHYLKLIAPDKTHAAVVSLHRGPKFWGYLGRCFDRNKKHYAASHGYAYFNQRSFPPDSHLYPLSEWQSLPRRKMMYDKTRYLLYILQTYRNSLDYVLWTDGDTVFANMDVALDDRVDYIIRRKRIHDVHDICLIWASDAMGPNAGVMLLLNTKTTRDLLLDTLTTYSTTDAQFDRFTDQASMIAAIGRNHTYTSCAVNLLSSSSTTTLHEEEEARWLQSRVRGQSKQLYQSKDWILHLPNHNRWELLQSLRKWLPTKLSLQHDLDEQGRCHTLQPIAPPNLNALSRERRDRYEAVRDAIQHAWKGYTTVALASSSLASVIPADDASPLSQTATSWLHYGATLHDALDTLYLANLTTEYDKIVSRFVSRDLQTTSYHPTKTFEYSLRIVGGLLGAYSLSGDARLLTQAKVAADALLDGAFRSSPTVLPRMFDMLAPSEGLFRAAWYRLYASVYRWGRDAFTQEHHFNSLAGVGSFIEFVHLSTVTGDERYRRAANAIFRHVSHRSSSQRQGIDESDQPMLPTYWNVMTGEAVNRGGALGSGADSFYEYLVKQPLLNGCAPRDPKASFVSESCSENDRAMLSLYQTLVAKAIRPKHALYGDANVSFPVDLGDQFHHLLCFVPGMLALGAGRLGNDETAGTEMLLARQLLEGCYRAYRGSVSGLAPEQARVLKGRLLAREGGRHEYLLRPEFVESLFVLYRLTKDVKYQHMGWRVFQSLETSCRVEHGYVGLENVHDPSSGRVDDTPSYFLAETLKYLLLLFGPDDYVALDEFVFTTEGHPLRRAGSHTLPLCFSRQGSPAPMPWILIIGLALGSTIMSTAFGSCYRGALWVNGRSKRKNM